MFLDFSFVGFEFVLAVEFRNALVVNYLFFEGVWFPVVDALYFPQMLKVHFLTQLVGNGAIG